MKGKTDMDKKTVLSVLAVLCAAMTACTAANDGESNVSETESVTAEVSAETTSETTETSVEITSLSTVETSETTALTTAETTVTENVPEKISVKAEDMTFTDFAFIEYYKGSKQEDETSEKAIEFLKTTEEYAQSQKYSDFYKEKYPEYFDENGVIIPKLHESYTEDYDGDGRDETFLLIDIPYSNYINTDDPSDSFSAVYSFLIFIGNDGNTELIDHNCGIYPPQMLDYGYNKQLVIGGSGSCGAEDHTIIWTVRDGKALCLYAFRGGVYKQDCFISVFGWQSSGGVMIFEPEKVMYIPVDGIPCDKEEIIRMDTDKNIEMFYEDLGEYSYVSLIGGKYYCVSNGFIDYGTIYTYSDGHFVLEKNSYIRNDHTYFDDEPGYANEVLVDFDYDKVTSGMTAVKAKIPSYSVDDINEYSVEWLKEDYAEFISDDSRTYTADEVKITAFYGIYGGFYAVRMSPYDDKVLLYGYDRSSEKTVFWDIETAYNNGILSESGRLMLESVIDNAK